MEKIKKTRQLLKILKAYTKLYGRIEKRYYRELNRLEKMMQHETGIEDIEFFFIDGEFDGIRNVEGTLELIHRSDLE